MENTPNKTGRTFWDFIAENKKLSLLAFSVLCVFAFGVIYLLVITKTPVKTPYLDFFPKSDTLTRPVVNSTPSLAAKPSKIKRGINTTENTSATQKTTEATPSFKIENNGINTGIMANQVTNVNVPPPNVDFKTWAVKNEKIDAVPESVNFHNIKLFPSSSKNLFFYHNRVILKYNSAVTLNKANVVFLKKDVIAASIGHPGMMQMVKDDIIEAPQELKGLYFISFNNPTNGDYFIDFYSLSPIEDSSKAIFFAYE